MTSADEDSLNRRRHRPSHDHLLARPLVCLLARKFCSFYISSPSFRGAGNTDGREEEESIAPFKSIRLSRFTNFGSYFLYRQQKTLRSVQSCRPVHCNPLGSFIHSFFGVIGDSSLLLGESIFTVKPEQQMTGSNSFLTTKMMLWTVLLLLVMGPSSCNAFHWQSNGHMVSQPGGLEL